MFLTSTTGRHVFAEGTNARHKYFWDFVSLGYKFQYILMINTTDPCHCFYPMDHITGCTLRNTRTLLVTDPAAEKAKNLLCCH